MTDVISSSPYARKDGQTRSSRLRALWSASLAHIVHDGYSDLLYLLFPIWQREFGLSLAAIGAMKTVFSGALASFQIPAARVADRFGERTVLAAGTVFAALAVIAYGFAGSVPLLFCFLLLAGMGAAVQHPLSSTIVASAFQNAVPGRHLPPIISLAMSERCWSPPLRRF